jgi:cytidine deaminase
MSELSPDVIDALVEAAAAVRKRAHAPYSRYAVGAAALDGQGRTHLGCNVENASYGLTVCAERHAVAAAVAAGATELRGVAVVTSSAPPASPCGACRQVLAEFGDFPVILANPDGDRRLTTVAELLPDAFAPGILRASQR